MNQQNPYIINTKESKLNKFPVIAQLAILGVIMLFIFGSLLFRSDATVNDVVVNEPVLPVSDGEFQLMPKKIKKVTIEATAAYVWDVRGQRVLYSKNADQQLPLASITKLMTTLLAHELLADDVRSKVTASAVLQEGGSGLTVGEQFSARQLRELALISSSNDAAYTLGANVGLLLGDSDPVSQFVRGMNIRAEELGFNSLEFWNTTGLDLSLTQPGALGSARDVSFLMEYIINKHPDIIAPTQKSVARVYNSVGSYHDIENTNDILLDIPNLIGSKTGYTDLAGGNLTIAFNAGLNRPIIVTVLGSTYDQRFVDVLTLVKAVQKTITEKQ